MKNSLLFVLHRTYSGLSFYCRCRRVAPSPHFMVWWKPTGADEEKRLFARDAMSAATPKNACVWCKNFLVVMLNKTDVRVGAIE